MKKSNKPNWNPQVGQSFESKGVNTTIINELVSFVPDITINCNPPYIKGKIDSCWVKYRKGNRPNDKQSWEFALGMVLQTML